MGFFDLKGDDKPSFTPAAPDVVDNFIQADLTGRAPSQAAVAGALAKKQPLISSTDEIKEGKEHLYFTEARALTAIRDYVEASSAASVEPKQDKISDSDEIKEGTSNLYFKPERALSAVSDFIEVRLKDALKSKSEMIESTDAVPEGASHLYFTPKRALEAVMSLSLVEGSGQAITSGAVYDALQAKQDVIKSSDDISEGIFNQYFKEDRVKKLIAEEIADLKTQLQDLSRLFVILSDELEGLKPKWSDAFMGGSGEVSVITGVSHKGARTQKLKFRAGSLVSIDGPMLSPISNEDK